MKESYRNVPEPQASPLDPADAGSYANRGLAYNKTGEYARAIEDLTHAIRLGAADTWVYRQRGYARNRTGEYAGAIEDLTQAIRLDPADLHAYTNRACAYKHTGEYALAVVDWSQSYLRITQTLTDFVRQVSSLSGPAANHRRLVFRLVLCTVSCLEEARNQFETAESDGNSLSGEPGSLRAVIGLGKGAADKALRQVLTGPALRSMARRFAAEAGRCQSVLSGRGQHGRSQAILGLHFARMCREGCVAVSRDRWPAERFWGALVLLTENRTLTGEPGGLSGYECLAQRTASSLLLCAIGPDRFKASVNRGWLAWGGGVVAGMAKDIYQHGLFHDMPVLADALEDAGCADGDMLAHCREPRHCCGCWVLDALRSPTEAGRDAGGLHTGGD